MSNYSASIYSTDENGTPVAAPAPFAPSASSDPSSASASAFAPGPLPFYTAPPPSSGDYFANSPSSSPPPSPPRRAPAPALAPVPALALALAPAPAFALPPLPPVRPPPPPPPPMATAFSEGKSGDGLKDLSEIIVLAEEVLSAVERDSKQGNIKTTLRETVLHKSPEFVVALGVLADRTDGVAKATRLSEHFKHLELFRVKAALITVLKVLIDMTKTLLIVVKFGKKMAKHVRVKMIERLGKFHYGIEQLCHGLEVLLHFKLPEYHDLRVQVKEVRNMLKSLNGEEEPANGQMIATER